jgi:hypothetical protein
MKEHIYNLSNYNSLYFLSEPFFDPDYLLKMLDVEKKHRWKKPITYNDWRLNPKTPIKITLSEVYGVMDWDYFKLGNY